MIDLKGVLLGRDIFLPMLDVVIIRRRPTKWEWQVRNREGTILMHGWETTRHVARYRGDRALFLLLAASVYEPPEMP